MIDMHSHCLPFIDDGADSVDTSLKMLQYAKQMGAHTVVATPHYLSRKNDVSSFLEKRNSSFSQLSQLIEREKDKYPRVLCGAEVYLGSDISEINELDKLCYENTNYMLLELSSSVECSVISEWIYNLTINGIKPVIAHIDRYEKHSELMEELNGIDVVYQINATRFSGLFSKRAVKSILKCGETFIVASDMHNLSSRPFNMHEAFIKAGKYLSADECSQMFEIFARKILGSQNL